LTNDFRQQGRSNLHVRIEVNKDIALSLSGPFDTTLCSGQVRTEQLHFQALELRSPNQWLYGVSGTGIVIYDHFETLVFCPWNRTQESDDAFSVVANRHDNAHSGCASWLCN